MMLPAPRLPLSLDPLIAEAKQRARRRWLSVGLGVVLLAGGTAAALAPRSSGPAGASPHAGPHGALGSMVSSALAQKSVHWTYSFANLASSARTSDVSANSAIEHVTYYWDPSATGRVTILRVGEAEYVKGNAVGLGYAVGATSAQAREYAGQWISIPKGGPGYTVYGLTVASVVHQAIPEGRLKLSLENTHGTRLLVVHGKTAGQGPFISTLTMQAGSKLPVSYSGGAMDIWIKSRFSKWNEPVYVTAPAHSVPVATVLRR